MANSFVHAKSSARRFGGQESDYQDIHDFFDSSKSAYADNRHRALFHHAFGIFVAEQLFGAKQDVDDLRALLNQCLGYLNPDDPDEQALFDKVVEKFHGIGKTRAITRPSDGVKVPIRIVAEQHVIEDHGYIPTVEGWLGNLPREDWMFKNAKPLSKILENYDATVAEATQPAQEPDATV